MKADEKFNKRAAKLVDIQYAAVYDRSDLSEGMAIGFGENGGDERDLRIHLTPQEAIKLAMELLEKAHRKLGLEKRDA
ncbi:hypothetical protein Phage2-1_00050 [Achromobacter phage 2-1]|nr:hypothetical protein Phage2-1_00050 [Achromobacter phage 2-1]